MLKTIIRSSITTVALFVAAAAMIIAGSIGAAQAAPAYQSEDYQAQVQLSNIHVGLKEYDNEIPNGGELLTSLLARNSEDKFKIGKIYNYELKAYNKLDEKIPENTIPQYVRVTIKKYWVDNNDNKDTTLDPSLIHLQLVNENDWVKDDAVSANENEKGNNTETTVLYYQHIVEPGDDTLPFTGTLMIDNKVLTEMKIDENNNLVNAYKDRNFKIEVIVDAVQTHSGTEAMKSAWGRTI